VDSAGSAYVTGFTNSTNFPTASPLQAAKAGGQDAFVLKLNPAGTALVYSTYLGGGGNDTGISIAVDSAGSAYVAGSTSSTNFPTASPLQPANAGAQDAFVLKLNPAGTALVYSTYLGGSDNESVTGIAVDSAGSAYVAGLTPSTNFPTVSPLQAANAGGLDVFVLKLNPAGTALVYSTYLGGSSADGGNSIAVDSAGSAYVTGLTNSADFPTASPLQAASAGMGDAFVTKLSSAGTALVYSTYLGGSGADGGNSIAVDSAGTAYITGSTSSTNFPTASPLQGSNAGGLDVFVTKIASHFYQGQDVAVGSDGKSRVLWTALDGKSVIWSMDNSFHTSFGPVFGPFNNWTVQSDAVGGDGLTRVLWTNTDGRAALWLEDADGMLTSTHIFGPFAGWSARDVDVGSDGRTRIL
jgi:hypothetical protein